MSEDAGIVVTVTSGHAPQARRHFRGADTQPLSVGTRSEWCVTAAGVADVHLWLRYASGGLYVAPNAGARVTLNGQPLSERWVPVGPGSTLAFGDAALQIARSGGPSLPAPAPAAISADRSYAAAAARSGSSRLPDYFARRLDRKEGHGTGRRPALFRAPDEPLDAERPAPARRRGIEGSPPVVLWLAILVPLLLLPLIFGAVLLLGRHPDDDAVARELASAALPSTGASTRLHARAPNPPLRLPPLPAPRALDTEARQRAPLLPPYAPRPGALLEPRLTPSEPALLATPAPNARPYPQNVADKPVPRIGDSPTEISEEWRQHHERLLHAPNRARAQVIFIGDSITEGWGVVPSYRELFSKYSPLDLGIASDMTQNVLWRLEQGEVDGTSPRAVVLMIGINNLAGGFSPESTARGVAAIVASLTHRLPDAHVVLLAVLPAHEKPDDPLRAKVIATNERLAALAGPHVSFHDFGSLVLEPDGTILKTTLRDFIHPTSEGYERLGKALVPILDEYVTAASE